jgi:hypothetical protein
MSLSVIVRQSLLALTVAACVLSQAAPVAAMDSAPGASMASSDEFSSSYLNREMLGLRPAIAFTEFSDFNNHRSLRFGVGMTIDYNAAQMLGLNPYRTTLGIQSGILLHHVGDTDSSLFGAGTPSVNRGQAGANLAMMPLNLRYGTAVMDELRISIHAGANAFYRNVLSSVRLTDNEKTWTLLPNVGADFEFSLSRSVALNVRPDWTVAGKRSVASAMMAVGFEM